MTTFQELGIRPALCDVLRSHGIKEATPVQEKAMPLVRAGHDCIVKAQTGTGKTLAFLLPIIEKIKPQAAVTQALVITPTRELAIQIAKVAQSLSAAADISSLVIFGGQDIERQKQKLRRHPQLIIGTPGRLLDHLRRQTIDLSQVNKVVLDEADEMMRLGFIEDVETLLEATA
ncbi:DEAD/DEAH box helicase, partial [Mitsuokella multacida]